MMLVRVFGGGFPHTNQGSKDKGKLGDLGLYK